MVEMNIKGDDFVENATRAVEMSTHSGSVDLKFYDSSMEGMICNIDSHYCEACILHHSTQNMFPHKN